MSDTQLWVRRAQGTHQRDHFVATTKWQKLPAAVATDMATADPEIEVLNDKEYQARNRAKASGGADKEE